MRSRWLAALLLLLGGACARVGALVLRLTDVGDAPLFQIHPFRPEDAAAEHVLLRFEGDDAAHLPGAMTALLERLERHGVAADGIMRLPPSALTGAISGAVRELAQGHAALQLMYAPDHAVVMPAAWEAGSPALAVPYVPEGGAHAARRIALDAGIVARVEGLLCGEAGPDADDPIAAHRALAEFYDQAARAAAPKPTDVPAADASPQARLAARRPRARTDADLEFDALQQAAEAVQEMYRTQKISPEGLQKLLDYNRPAVLLYLKTGIELAPLAGLLISKLVARLSQALKLPREQGDLPDLWGVLVDAAHEQRIRGAVDFLDALADGRIRQIADLDPRFLAAFIVADRAFRGVALRNSIEQEPLAAFLDPAQRRIVAKVDADRISRDEHRRQTDAFRRARRDRPEAP
ncbi:MAG: hypothetical protein HY552_02845 [Elusimicrobia bacterium]|nr:hypothetical protein [Elusimicrobiota bacterium]